MENFKTLEEIQKELPNTIVKNDMIKSMDINIIGHFGNLPALEVRCLNSYPFHGYNNLSNLGYLIRKITELLGITKEDGINLSKINSIPCRILFDDSKVIGIGNFMKNKFILIEDLILIKD